MKLRVNFILKIFGSLMFLLGLCFFSKKIVYAKKNLIKLQVGTPYKEVVAKYGKPKNISVFPGFVNIKYFENKSTYYMLCFNKWFRLESLTIVRETPSLYGSSNLEDEIIFFDNRSPLFFAQGEKKSVEDLERLPIGTLYGEIISEYGKPSEIGSYSENKYCLYKLDENRSYKLSFSDSGKLNRFEIIENDEKKPLFFDTRID
ncbi:hypothetical protein [Treponema sp.]|uniref:hypothetical protein n=1 Tax=Treponema sp. TaxID=166 RepID=UPI003890ACE8